MPVTFTQFHQEVSGHLFGMSGSRIYLDDVQLLDVLNWKTEGATAVQVAIRLHDLLIKRADASQRVQQIVLDYAQRLNQEVTND
jgi:hypothetical protein